MGSSPPATPPGERCHDWHRCSLKLFPPPPLTLLMPQAQQEGLGADLAGLLQPPVPPGGGAAAAAAAEQGLEPGGDDLYDPEDL